MASRFIARALTALTAALIAGAASAAGLSCPNPQPLSQPGVIKETVQQIADLAPVLSGADVTMQIPAIVDALRKRYPNAQAAEIANFLITAYCPGVAMRTDLDDAGKTARVQAFSRAVLKVLY